MPREVAKEEAAAPEAPAPRREVTEADMLATKLTTKALLDAMPKMPVRLVARGKNDPNFETVCINGYIIQIKRGEQVEVPQVVYDILEEGNLI